MTMINIPFTERELQVVKFALGKLPFEQVAPVYLKIESIQQKNNAALDETIQPNEKDPNLKETQDESIKKNKNIPKK